MKISAVLPIYNEEKVVREIIKRLDKIFKELIKNKKVEDYEIIAIDDGSTDDTREILKKIKIEKLKIITHRQNIGYGGAIKTGIKNSKFDWIFIVDCDNTYPIEEIPNLIKYCEEYDMVIGARTKKGAKIPFLRKFPKWLLNKYASFLSGYKIPDLNSGMRFFKKELSLKYWKLYPNKFSFTSVLTMAAILDGYNIIFIPIDYYKREGKSSINPIKDTIRFFSLVSRMTFYFNPLKPFFLLGIMTFSLGFMKSIIDFINVNHIGNFALFMFIFSAQLFFFGIVLDILIKFLKS